MLNIAPSFLFFKASNLKKLQTTNRYCCRCGIHCLSCPEPLMIKDKKVKVNKQKPGDACPARLMLIVIKCALIQRQAALAAIPMLCVRPSSRSVKFNTVSNEAECVPEALAQGRLFCKVSFCVSALCALQMCLPWCVGSSCCTEINL